MPVKRKAASLFDSTCKANRRANAKTLKLAGTATGTGTGTGTATASGGNPAPRTKQPHEPKWYLLQCLVTADEVGHITRHNKRFECAELRAGSYVSYRYYANSLSDAGTGAESFFGALTSLVYVDDCVIPDPDTDLVRGGSGSGSGQTTIHRLRFRPLRGALPARGSGSGGGDGFGWVAIANASASAAYKYKFTPHPPRQVWVRCLIDSSPGWSTEFPPSLMPLIGIESKTPNSDESDDSIVVDTSDGKMAAKEISVSLSAIGRKPIERSVLFVARRSPVLGYLELVGLRVFVSTRANRFQTNDTPPVHFCSSVRIVDSDDVIRRLRAANFPVQLSRSSSSLSIVPAAGKET